MPIVDSPFRLSGPFKNNHFSTIYSAKIRNVKNLKQERERLELPDGDFLDIDWSYGSAEVTKVAVLFHGLEGNAQRTYMRGMAKLLCQHGYDVAAINFRGCSGIQNRLYRSYHSGDTGDIRFVLKTIDNSQKYQAMALYGVSLGGNAMLKYLGEQKEIPEILKVAAAIGVPADLKVSLEQLSKRENWLYRTSFLFDLRRKYRKKMPHFPEQLSWERYHKIRSLKTFDDFYTAPAHGFVDALDYYKKASSLAYLPEIKIPTLILSAQNDSFLHGDCYPYVFAKASSYLHLETPQHGGHVGFHLSGDFYYNEKRSLDFFEQNMR